MKAVEFEGQTIILQPPVGFNHQTNLKCGGLPVLHFQYENKIPVFVSYWKLTGNDLKLLTKGYHIRLDVLNPTHPPVGLMVDKCEELP